MTYILQKLGLVPHILGSGEPEPLNPPRCTTAFKNKTLLSSKHLQWGQTNVHGVFGDGMQGSCTNDENLIM